MSRQNPNVLAGDIGGTHARLALFEVGESQPTLLEERVFSSPAYDGLEPIVQEFLGALGESPSRACFGVACPIEEGVCHFTNLGWEIRREGFGQRIGIKDARIINDFAAIGYGIPVLLPEDLETLQEGTSEERGPIALIGAGTGLGEAYLTWGAGEGARYQVHASEGGHADFAPADFTQWRLLRHLQVQYGHVSWERVVSGQGLVDAYAFLRDSGYAPERDELHREFQEEGKDPAEIISNHAMAESDPLSIKALEIFLNAFGAQAGNLALTIRATGGVYLAGGIAPKVLPKLKGGPFVRAFGRKGRLGEFVRKIPVRVIVNDSVGLLGAAALAGRS